MLSLSWQRLATLGFILACGGLLAADPPAKPVFDDPANVTDPDFEDQGEYVGTINDSGQNVKFGAQVIALGNGRFSATSYRGGLPGDGGDPTQRQETTGMRVGDAVEFQPPDATARLSRGKIVVRSNGGEVLGTLEKVVRKSPTLGIEPPENAIVLFDGKSEGDFAGSKVTHDGLLIPAATSRTTFNGSFKLHVEFRTPYAPQHSSQGRGNSGCYLQGRYEVQILDSFGMKGLNNECGGIYGVKAPDVNMAFPPLAWQTYDIEFQSARFDAAGKKTANARMTVRHNGVLIHRDVEVPHSTTASPLGEGPEAGPIYLQDHGDPVRFRNVFVVPQP